MEAFFNLILPKSWADLSDPQLLCFFRQFATDVRSIFDYDIITETFGICLVTSADEEDGRHF